MNITTFWDTLVDENIVTPDEMCRAQVRFAELGGGIDTCIAETVVLSEGELDRVIELAAVLHNLPTASSELLDAPDLEALARLSETLFTQVPLLPTIDLEGREAWVIPPVAPMVYHDLAPLLKTRQSIYIAREIDLWMVLNQLRQIDLPARMINLWRGQTPALLSEGYENSPMPIPRSTWLSDENDTLGDSPGETESGGPGTPRQTQPSTPMALGIADTTDFQTDMLQKQLARRRLERILSSSSSMRQLGRATSDIGGLREASDTTPPR